MNSTARREHREFAEGDLLEMYEYQLARDGARQAQLWLFKELAASLPSFIKNTIYWNLVMFYHYLTIFTRNVLRHKGYSFLNISGLAVGVACCLMIGLWLSQEISYDRFHTNAPRLHQILIRGSLGEISSTPAPLAAVLKRDFPEVVGATRFENLGKKLIRGGEQTYKERVHAVDPEFMSMFSFPLIYGDPGTALNKSGSIVITEDQAARFFGDIDAVGRVLSIEGVSDFTVTGVTENIPNNSTLSFGMLVRYDVREKEALESVGKEMGWGWYSPNTFVQLRPGTSVSDFDAKIVGVLHDQAGEETDELLTLPFTSRHAFFWDSDTYIYIFSGVALLVLVVASMNFVNLTTARSLSRSKEVGLRKVVGAHRGKVVTQMLSEAVILSGMAVLLAVLLVALILPFFNKLSGLELSWAFIPIGPFILLLAGLTLVIGVAAGLYPAFVMSAFQPISVIKETVRFGSRGKIIRRVLVTLQFAASAILIMGTLIVHQQVDYIKGADLGYRSEGVLKVNLDGVSPAQYRELSSELSTDRRITGVSASHAAFPYLRSQTSRVDWRGKDKDADILVVFNGVDYGFVETMGINIKEGRSFSREFETDASGFLINEKMAELMGIDSVVGAGLSIMGQDGHVLGVMSNFNHRLLSHPVEPVVFFVDTEKTWEATIRIDPHDVQGGLDRLRTAWDRCVPDYPLEYTFVDAQLDAAYGNTERMGTLASFFAGLGLIVACLGLIGLAAYSAQVRSKEIAVRKVLGATMSRIVVLLTRELAGCVFAGNLLAMPLAYLLLRNWLEGFAYHTEFGPAAFTLPLLLSLFAAAVATGTQALRAARSNVAVRLKLE